MTVSNGINSCLKIRTITYHRGIQRYFMVFSINAIMFSLCFKYGNKKSELPNGMGIRLTSAIVMFCFANSSLAVSLKSRRKKLGQSQNV